MRVAITGATGSLGGALLEWLCARPGYWDGLDGVVAISRDEVKGGDLAARYADWAPLKCVLADVRDQERLTEVFRGCQVVIHAAALKRISHSVYSPGEMVKTNVVGTMNVVHAATEVGVERVVVVSSDKAVEATNLYGATKFTAETYAVQSNSYSYPRGTRVAVVRYGNVLGSRGSVVHVWRDQLARRSPVTITDKRMTRFIITLPQAAKFVMRAVSEMTGGEVFVPRLPAAKMVTLADAVIEEYARETRDEDPPDVEVTGLRPGGEKLHEALISREEPTRAWLTEDCERIVVHPSHHSWTERMLRPSNVRCTMPYTSDEPCRWLDRDELVAMLREVPR